MTIQTAERAFVVAADRAVAVAGFRTKRTLFCDKFLYVDDLATLASERSKGYGYEANDLYISGYHFKTELAERVPWSR